LSCPACDDVAHCCDPEARARIVIIVDAQKLRRVFPMPAGPIEAVRDVSMRVATGDYVAIMGPSGCGKSTLLHLLGCVDTATSGSLSFEGRDIGRLSEVER